MLQYNVYVGSSLTNVYKSVQYFIGHLGILVFLFRLMSSVLFSQYAMQLSAFYLDHIRFHYNLTCRDISSNPFVQV